MKQLSRSPFLWVAFLLLSVARPVAAAEPVAVLVQAAGGVQLQKAGASGPVPARPGTPLAVNDQVIVPAAGRAVVLYRSGKMVTATKSLRIEAPPGSQPAGVFRQTVKTLGEIAATDARTQPNRQGMIRPIAGAAVPIAPRNGVRLLDPRPTFRWTSVPEATEYVVQIRALPGGIERYSVGPDTAWTVPVLVALSPGKQYEWSVAAGEDGRAAPPQQFTVASTAERAEMEARIAAIRDAGVDPDGDGLFLKALLLRDAGYLYEAVDALSRMEAAGQERGSAVHLLRGEILDALGDLDGAAAAFRLAAEG